MPEMKQHTLFVNLQKRAEWRTRIRAELLPAIYGCLARWRGSRPQGFPPPMHVKGISCTQCVNEMRESESHVFNRKAWSLRSCARSVFALLCCFDLISFFSFMMQELEQTLAHWRATKNEIRLLGESAKDEEDDDEGGARGEGDENSAGQDQTPMQPTDQQQRVPEGDTVAKLVDGQLRATARALIEQEDVMEHCIERCENGHLETIGLNSLFCVYLCFHYLFHYPYPSRTWQQTSFSRPIGLQNLQYHVQDASRHFKCRPSASVGTSASRSCKTPSSPPICIWSVHIAPTRSGKRWCAFSMLSRTRWL